MLKSLFKLFFVFIFFSGAAILPNELHAQNSRDVEIRKAPGQAVESKSGKKLSKKEARKKLEKSYSTYFNGLVGEYEDRMVANVKKRNDLAKEYSKPQYSNPSYFGHKKTPKKRANGKKRKCKECHMWH